MQKQIYILLYIGFVLCAPLYGHDNTGIYNHNSNNKERFELDDNEKSFVLQILVPYIQNINIEAYARAHHVTPEQLIHKIYYNRVSNEDFQHYVTYRAAYRAQQRCISQYNTRSYNDPFLHRLLHHYVIDWSPTKSDVVNLAETFLPSSHKAYICHLDEGVLARYNTNEACIYLNTTEIQPDFSYDWLITIEHEITHSEHKFTFHPTWGKASSGMVYTRLLYSRKQFNTNNIQSHHEFEADWESARFTPLPYTLQISLENETFYNDYYFISSSPTNNHIKYPPSIWLRNILAKRASLLPQEELNRQKNIYLSLKL